MSSEQGRDEIQDQRKRLRAYIAAINNCISLETEDHVYWMERTGKRLTNIHIHAAPMDVAQEVKTHLLERNTSAILTSATLATSGSMNTFQERIGAEDVENSIVNSPFDYEVNMRIRIARNVPEPTRDQGKLNIQYLCHYIQETSCKTMVVYSSYLLATMTCMQLLSR